MQTILGCLGNFLLCCISLNYSLLVLEILLRSLEPIISLRVSIQVSTSILLICLVLW